MDRKNDIKLLKRTLIHFVNTFYKINKILISLFVFLSLLIGLSSILNVYILKFVIDSFSSIERNNILAILGILFYGAVHTLWIYFKELNEYLSTKINDRVTINLQKEFLDKLDKIPYNLFEGEKLLNTIEKIRWWLDYEPTQSFLAELIKFIPILTSIFITGFALFNLGYFSFLILIIFSLPTLFISNMISDASFFITDSRSPVFRIYLYLKYLNIELESKKEIRLYSSYNRLWRKIEGIMQDFASVNGKRALSNLWLKYSAETSQIVGQLIVIYFFIINSEKNLSLGEIILNISFVSLFTGSIISLMKNISTIRGTLVTFSDYVELLEIPDENRGEKVEVEPFSTLEFKDVSFKYEGQEEFAIENLNLKINRGDKLAIVGVNGSGKTTLIKLMLRFYEPTSGKILLNGVEASTIDLNVYLKEFSAIFQDFTKYELTVRENIEFGNPEVIDENLYEKSKYQSDSTEIIDRLEKRDEQILTKTLEGGTELSGGQWQRIALARMYYRNAGIFILDEPTASIDAISEAKIFKRVNEVSEGKTVIIISHRFSTVREADRIIVLERGKIIEDGNHEELIRQQGKYAEMFNLQADGYR